MTQIAQQEERPTATPRPLSCQTAADFASDEEGSMLLFGLYLFIGILLIGGISVDIMRNEYSRLGLQNTVDTAVLAAADLDQRLDPHAVVVDYFDKAGLSQYLDSIQVVEHVNSRMVTANSSIDVRTFFINALGVESMPARADGTAREEISDIEISMVLDISGSMGQANRLRDLKTAASNFVNTVLSDERVQGGNGEVSLSIVPYSTQVNIGPTVAGAMNLSMRHDYSHCVDFETPDFDSTELPDVERNQTGHFDPFTTSSPPRLFVCRDEPASHAQLITENRLALLAQINGLEPDGNTSTDVGIKWGMALLDPSFREITADLIATGEVQPNFAERPYDFDRPNTMKVLVVMTDGAHTTQHILRDAYNQGMSDVWAFQNNPNDWRFSVDHAEHWDKDGDGESWEPWYITRTKNWDNNRDGGNSNSQRLSYRELWNVASIRYNARHMWRNQDNSSSLENFWRNGPQQFINSSTKDQRMKRICEEAKAKGVLVFSVAFEIDESDARLMKECASSPNHYFDVDGEDIIYAFSAIASTINQLRLIQ